MSVGTVIALMVALEGLVLGVAVRWLIAGLRPGEGREWPPVLPVPTTTVAVTHISTSASVPSTREGNPRSNEAVVGAS